MKKTMRMMLALMAGAMAFTACSSDDILENNENMEVIENAPQLKTMTFTAVQEGQGTTRTAIDNLSIKWTAGDEISIFDGAGVQQFTLATGDGTTSATFTGSAASPSTYYALYPYTVGETMVPVTKADALAAFGQDEMEFQMEVENEWDSSDPTGSEMDIKNTPTMSGLSDEKQAIIFAYLKGESITTPGVQLDGSSIKGVVIPAEQTVTASQTVDPDAMVMVAMSDDANALEFKNVCAYVKVTPQFDCYAIALTSKGSENLAGTVTVNYNDGEPTTTVTADGTNSVSLLGTITAGNAYYIAVRPEALASGFTIEFLTAIDKKYYARSTNKQLALARSNVKNLGEFITSGTWTYKDITTHGTDNGHDWALLSPGGIKIATTKASGNVLYANRPNWGEGWELPSVADFQSIYNNGLYYANGTVTLKGKGILKHVLNVEIKNTWDLWTSTPGTNDPTKQMCFYASNNGNTTERNKTQYDLSGVLFKYTK